VGEAPSFSEEPPNIQVVPTIELEVDNQSAMAIAEKTTYRTRTKHIDVRYHFVREALTSGAISLKYTPTEVMIADGLTKALGGPAFERFRKRLKIEEVEIPLSEGV
jgi:hypothetical protein